MAKTDIKKKKGPPQITPLGEKSEQQALQIFRYQRHMENLSRIEKQIHELMSSLQQGQHQLHELQKQVGYHVAEARDQVTLLVNEFDMTQKQIDRLAPVPQIVGMTNIQAVIEQAGPPGDPEPDVVVGGDDEKKEEAA